MSVSSQAASQSETGDVITMNISSDTPKPFTVIHEYNMTPPTTVYHSESGNETDSEHEPQDEIESPTVIHEYNMTPPTTDSESGNETDLEYEPQDEDGSRYTLFVRLEKGQYRTMCYQRGEINWANPVNNYRVRVSDHLQDSFQHLGLAMEMAPDAVLELKESLGTNREVTVEVFLQLLRWSLNDRHTQLCDIVNTPSQNQEEFSTRGPIIETNPLPLLGTALGSSLHSLPQSSSSRAQPKFLHHLGQYKPPIFTPSPRLFIPPLDAILEHARGDQSVPSTQNLPATADFTNQYSALPMSRRLKPWSAEESAILISLRNNGMKWREIAKHFPSRGVPSCRLRYLRFHNKPVVGPEPWSAEEVATLIDLRKKGMKWKEIAIYFPSRGVQSCKLRYHYQIKKPNTTISNTTISEDDTTISEDDTTISQDDTTISKDDTTISQDDTTISKDDTTISQDDTTISQDDTTISKDDTTISQDDTTISILSLFNPAQNQRHNTTISVLSLLNPDTTISILSLLNPNTTISILSLLNPVQNQEDVEEDIDKYCHSCLNAVLTRASVHPPTPSPRSISFPEADKKMQAYLKMMGDWLVRSNEQAERITSSASYA
ncbi:hypothetical protein B0T10DRAFT_580925 [Thelonectria olida]|uniref:Myb-like domain-containing protein n=1 Tax=Thelonectria olida TaxID=1576542 RepID=A0A9P8VW00_9HYPO|nr:hypothetical protein B0T10DRAFT_580925 [Thelonectria olida]